MLLNQAQPVTVMKRAMIVLHSDQGIRNIAGRSDRLCVAHDMLPEQRLQLGVPAVLVTFASGLVNRHIPTNAATIGASGGNTPEIPVIRRFGNSPKHWHRLLSLRQK